MEHFWLHPDTEIGLALAGLHAHMVRHVLPNVKGLLTAGGLWGMIVVMDANAANGR